MRYASSWSAGSPASASACAGVSARRIWAASSASAAWDRAARLCVTVLYLCVDFAEQGQVSASACVVLAEAGEQSS